MPPRSTSRVSDTALKNAKPKATPYKLSVGHGLYLEITPKGAKLWRWKYRIAGKENRFAIGAYPEYSLAEAREEVTRARKLVKQGVHPAHEKRLAKIHQANAHANTFQAVAEEWLGSNGAHWTVKSRTQRERALQRDVYPYIGRLPIRQVTLAHVLDILKRIEKRAPAVAVVVKQAISAICRLAVSTLRADIDPTQPLEGALKQRQSAHHRPLKANELPRFLKAIDATAAGIPTKAALKLMLYTLARSMEVVRAEWSEFDFDSATWTVPAPRMKMREDHVIPLSDQAVTLLRQLKAISPDRIHVFPNRRKPKQPASTGILWKAVASMGFEGFSPHGVRATGSTILNGMGFRPDYIERQLAHVERDKSRASYNHAIYLDERRDMMQQWADYLEQLVKGAAVVSINSKRAG